MCIYLYHRNTYIYHIEGCFYTIGTRLLHTRVVNAKIYALSFTYKCTKMFTLINVSKYMERKEIKKKRNESTGRARWLTPVIPALREAEVGASHEVGSRRPA